MPTPFEGDVVRALKLGTGFHGPGVACVSICHNEARIISQFIDHYRSLGCGNFLIVDDRSDDGTREFLMDQDDVSVFTPVEGTAFRTHIAAWRQEILDAFCDGTWVTLPDIDEFLYYKDTTASLSDLSARLEARGEEALLAVMLDMYGDKPLSEQFYTGERPLLEEFPYFDGCGDPPAGMRIVAKSARLSRRYPTPSVKFAGGMRDRMFFVQKDLNFPRRWLIRNYANMGRPLAPGIVHRVQNRISHLLTKNLFSDSPLVMNKFALLQWRKGMTFSRAPHFVDASLRMSESLAAMLHFKFYKGKTGFEYASKRQQHSGGSFLYKKILSETDVFDANPFCDASVKFDGVDSLGGYIR